LPGGANVHNDTAVSCAKIAAIWVVDSSWVKEAQVQSYSPTWEGTLAPPGEYDWTVHVQRRCGLMSNYFDHVLWPPYV